MDAIEIAWVAGFFEGEGNIHATPNPESTQSRGLRLQIVQNEREPLERVQEVLGGRIGGPYTRKRGGRKVSVSYSWWAFNREAERAIALIEPYFSKRRREQLEIMRERVHAHKDHWEAKRLARIPNKQP